MRTASQPVAVAACALALAGPAMTQPGPSAPFRSVQLRDGGSVVLRHGLRQSVSFLQGSPRFTHIEVAGGRLMIDNCRPDCPPHYEAQIEITTPDIAMLSVADGGLIESRGGFPAQMSIAVAIREGGTIDIRSMAAAGVGASVIQGGRIFTRPGAALYANVAQGGAITYWGSAVVKSQVLGGGVVARGRPADFGKPLSALAPRLPPLPALPPLANMIASVGPARPGADIEVGRYQILTRSSGLR